LQLDIAVVGCGPGGMAAALFLNRQGHKVTIFERFETPQPLGSGLLIQPSGQAVLSQLGLLEAIRERGHLVDRLHGVSLPSGKRALDMQYCYGPDGTCALGIHRASLFDILYEAVLESEIKVECGQTMTGVRDIDTKITPEIGELDHSEHSFDLLIDASGARSPLAQGQIRRLPFGAFWGNVDMPRDHAILPDALDQRYFHAEKMAGIMPIGINPDTGNQGAALFWSEKPERAEMTVNRGIAEFQKAYVSLWPEAEPFVAQLTSMDDLTMAVYHHQTGSAYRSPRLLFVGDSWHCTSPQLGQGANMALIDAQALAMAIENSKSIEAIAPAYAQTRKFHIGLYQALSFVFTPLYQSENRFLPLFRDVSIHYFAQWPVIRGFIARTVSGGLGLS